MAYPGEATHQRLHALLLTEQFKDEARKAEDEHFFVRQFIQSKGFDIELTSITPAPGMGREMRKIAWNLRGDASHPHCTYYYL